MTGKGRGIPASQLARDYGVSLSDFSEEVIALLARIEAAGSGGLSNARRREVCAAVSAAMYVALDSSTLAPEERARLEPLVHGVLEPFWNKHCKDDTGAAAYIIERAPHYLAGRSPGSRVKTAVAIVSALLDALEVPEPQRGELSRTLSASFAHRMVADQYRIDDLRLKYGIELSLLATISAVFQFSMNCDAVLRLLRLG
jgi:hypothetical protein